MTSGHGPANTDGDSPRQTPSDDAFFGLGGGDVTTIPQGPVDFNDPLGDPIGVGAWKNSRWSLLGGQSGNPCVAIAWSEEAVERRATATLRLSS